MSTLRCQAKDPATCSYHRPNAGAIQHARLQVVAAELKIAERGLNVRTTPNPEADYLTARYAHEEAENAYYATPDGLISLAIQAENTKDADTRSQLESRLELANYQVAEAERQNNIDNVAGGALIPEGKSTYEVPTFVRSGNDDLWPVTKGNKHDPALSTREIATKMAADFKQAQKEGYLPKHLKFRVMPYSKNRSIDVRIIGATSDQINDDIDNPNGYTSQTSAASELLARTNSIANAYNRKQYDVVEGRTNTTTYWNSNRFETDNEMSVRVEKEAESLRKREAKKATS